MLISFNTGSFLSCFAKVDIQLLCKGRHTENIKNENNIFTFNYNVIPNSTNTFEMCIMHCGYSHRESFSNTRLSSEQWVLAVKLSRWHLLKELYEEEVMHIGAQAHTKHS